MKEAVFMANGQEFRFELPNFFKYANPDREMHIWWTNKKLEVVYLAIPDFKVWVEEI